MSILPYIELPELPLFPGSSLSLKPVGVLWLLGLTLAAYVSFREAKRRGLDREKLTSLLCWMMGLAFVVGHLFDLVLYAPDDLWHSPGLLLDIWQSQSSFGGLLGAFAGTEIWHRRHGTPRLPYVDVVASSFPLGFGVGRLGCAVAHDHPGVFSNSPLAVPFPEGSRFDLGLLEAMSLFVLAVGFHFLRRRQLRVGSFLGIACVVYACLRFGLDFLRVADARYLGLTPAQWLAPLLLASGVMFFRRIGAAPAAATRP